MKYISFLIFLFLCETVNAQFTGIKWCFGDSAGIDFTNLSNPTTFKTAVKSRGSVANVCNRYGDLQFYAYTMAGMPGNLSGVVFDASNNVMQNGNNMVGEGWYYEYVILPMPNDTTKYYLFQLGVTQSPLGLRYSIIDMQQNNGLGAVTQKNIQVNSMKANDGLTAIKHGNGRDWWVIFKKYDGVSNNIFYKYLVDPLGVNLVDSQAIGSTASTNTIRLNFNKDGSKLCAVNYSGVTDIFDFDRCTGILSNHILLKSFTFPPVAEFWGSEFSASGRFLYIATSGYYNPAYLVQVDLQNPLLYAAADTINSITAVVEPGGQLKRGPDDKIYWACAYTDGFNFNYPYPDTLFNTYNTYLSVINLPDSLGSACNFTPYSFYLGGARTYWGLPNNPDYDLGPLLGSPCDTLGLALEKPPNIPHGDIKCTYISAWEKLFVNASGVKGKDVTVTIYGSSGLRVYQSGSLLVHSGYVTLDVNCNGWSDGIYIVNLQSEKESMSTKFVKQ